MKKELFQRLVAIRRQLHRNPELGFQEFQTAALVEEELGALAIPTRRITKTGIIGTLKKGDGPTIVLRADMDALPIKEETNLPFESAIPMAMHACGHDLHTAMLLGAAHELRNTGFEGTIKFIFQPSEEGNAGSPEPGKTGGELMVDSGALNDADAILGLHVQPLLPVGRVEYKEGETLANVGNFTILITGKGGHPGAMQHVIDPVVVAARLIAEAQSLVKAQLDNQAAVFACTHIETLAKPSFNVIPSAVEIRGTIRTIKLAVYQEIKEKLYELIRDLDALYRVSIELDFSLYVPSLLNDPLLHKNLSQTLHDVFGSSNVVEAPTRLIGEDFSFYSRKIPAQFYFLGAKSNGNSSYFLHHPKVIFNEECINYGTPFLAKGALELMRYFSSPG